MPRFASAGRSGDAVASDRMSVVVCPVCGAPACLVREGDRLDSVPSASSVPGPLAVCAGCGAFVAWVGPELLAAVPRAEIEALSPARRDAFLSVGGAAPPANALGPP